MTTTVFGVESGRVEECLRRDRVLSPANAPAVTVERGDDSCTVTVVVPGRDDPVTRDRGTRVFTTLAACFGAERVSARGESLAVTLLGEMREHGLALAAAESCTGGMLASTLTAIPGSSDVFWGSLVTYAYEAKVSMLGVSQTTLDREGAVSEACVREMADGLRDRSGADVAVSISGIAGPGGGTPDKPVGTVWLGIAMRHRETVCRLLQLSGSRREIQFATVCEALVGVRRRIASG